MIDMSDVTYIHPDLKAGMTIEWSEPPDYLNVVAVSFPDVDGMVSINAVEGQFVIAGDCTFTEITCQLADLIGLLMITESDRQEMAS